MLSARAQRYSIASETPSEGYDSAVIDFLSDIEHDQQVREEERQGVLSRGRDMISRMLGQTEEQVARPEYLPQEGSASSSSGVAMPTGINPVPLPKEENQTHAYWQKKTVPEIKEEPKKIGITVKGTGLAKNDWVELIVEEMRKKK
jgi:hypothetical protein